MQFLKTTIFIFSCVLLFAACERMQTSRRVANDSQATQVAQSKSVNEVPADSVNRSRLQEGDLAKGQIQPISLKQADQSETVAQAVERKIIKDGELTLEVASPPEAQRHVTSIAESHNGYVVTSESKQNSSSDGTPPLLDITLVLRVPSAQFGAVYDQIQSLSKNVTQQKQTGQDVTEEFIDLEAHIKTQKALEAQFLEIMKQAHKVEDALEVQRQIAGVRSEIEKLEGRKRFLENRSSLSTITVNLKPVTAIVVNSSGFGRSVKEAISESIEVGGELILFLIRFVIVMIPIFVLIILPIGLVARYFVRRARRIKLARDLTGGLESPAPST